MADIILDDYSINQPVDDLTALAAVPTANLKNGCIVFVLSENADYRWNGSGWVQFALQNNFQYYSSRDAASLLDDDTLPVRSAAGTNYYSTAANLRTYFQTGVRDITPFDSEVDGVTSTPPFYQTLGDVVTAGGSAVYQSADSTETGAITLSKDMYIFIGKESTLNLQSNSIDFNIASNITIIGEDNETSVLKFTPTTGGQLLFENILLNSRKLELFNLKIDVKSTTVNSSLADLSNEGVIQIANCNIITPVAGNQFTISIAGPNSYINDSKIIGSSQSTNNCLRLRQGATSRNLSLVGTFANTGATITILGPDCRATGLYVDATTYEGFTGLNIIGAGNMGILGDVTAADTELYNINIINGGISTRTFNIYNCQKIKTLEIDETAPAMTGYITGCEADVCTGVAANNVERAACNDIIGNSYQKIGSYVQGAGYSSLIQVVANDIYTAVAYTGCAGKIIGLGELARALTTAGTLSVSINGTPVTGLTAVVPTTAGSYTSASGANSFARGDKIEITYTGTTAILDHSILIDYEQLLV